MGEEAAAMDEYELDSGMVAAFGGVGEDERVMEWETGLPGSDELTPLFQPLVPPGLAAAFRIPPEPGRTLLDVHRASAATVSRLRRASSSSGGGGGSFPPYADNPYSGGGGGNQQKAPPPPPAGAGAGADPPPAADSPGATNNNSSKRPRLVWTPQLHKRFVDVVAHLGIKNAVPKTIMQLMNVEGLTRENVASHLQKYRLYVKRMRGLSFSNDNDDGDPGPSPSDHHIFASTPVPHSLILQHDSQPQQQVVPTPPPQPQHHPYMYQHHQYHHRVPAAAGYAAAYPSHQYHHAGHAADN